MVIYNINPSTEASGSQKFEVSLAYKGSSRRSRAITEKKFTLKKKLKNQKPKQKDFHISERYYIYIFITNLYVLNVFLALLNCLEPPMQC